MSITKSTKMVYLGSWLGLFFFGRLRGNFNPWVAEARLELEVGQVSAWVISLSCSLPPPLQIQGVLGAGRGLVVL